jgi:cyclophilin family peptidyl-prolyl cis-trans isomerase
MRRLWAPIAVALAFTAAPAAAQPIPSGRLAILQAASRSAPDARDLAAMRAGVRSSDGETARLALRGLGRLRKPALVGDVAVGLRSPLPEVRAEAANAIAQALSPASPPAAAAIDGAFTMLASTLDAEVDANVRANLLEAIGRLPHRDVRQADRAAGVLVSHAQSEFVMDRLGVAKGLETLIRTGVRDWQPSAAVIDALRGLLALSIGHTGAAGEGPVPGAADASTHDARVRRLALEGLIAAQAIDDAVLDRAFADGDPQMRRLGILAIERAGGSLEQAWQAALRARLADRAALVRVEAVRVIGRPPATVDGCQISGDATHDPEPQVMAAAFQNLGDCAFLPEMVTYLEQIATSPPESPPGGSRAGPALEALVRAAPERARPLLQQLAVSPSPQLRLYVARAAAVLGEREVLTNLLDDAMPMVRTVARSGLGMPEPAASSAETKGASASDLNAADLRRLAAPRARVTVRGLGAFDLALVTAEAPFAVLRFVRLAEGGFFDQTMVAARSTRLINIFPSVNEVPAAAGRPFSAISAEPGLWPHVRGTIGLSSDGAETGGAQVFVNLVDNPAFDHQLTVFAQVLNGIDIVERLLDGDVIEKIDILP